VSDTNAGLQDEKGYATKWRSRGADGSWQVPVGKQYMLEVGGRNTIDQLLRKGCRAPKVLRVDEHARLAQGVYVIY
jgi:hypothetical protein